MSWSVATTEPEHYPGILDEIDELEPSYIQPSQISHETAEQIRAAKVAAKRLIESGAVGNIGGDGDPGVRFQVMLGGHANLNHEPKPGCADDTINVTVRQVSR